MEIKFVTAYGKNPTKSSPCGNRYEKTFILDEETGELVVTGKRDLQAEIQASAEDGDLKTIMAKVIKGEPVNLGQMEPIYDDFTDPIKYPKTIHDAHAQGIAAQAHLNKISDDEHKKAIEKDLKEKQDNSTKDSEIAQLQAKIAQLEGSSKGVDK